MRSSHQPNVFFVLVLTFLFFTGLSLESYAQSKASRAVQERLLVLVLDKQGALPNVQKITNKLKRAMENNLDIRVVSDEEAFVVFDRNVVEMFSSCRGDPVCLARLVQNLDARYLLVVSSSQISNSIVLGLRYVDLKKRTTIGQAIHKVASSSDIYKEIEGQLPKVVPEEMWQPYGSVNISTPQERVQVFLDDQLVGISPIKRLERITPSVHEIRFELEGYLPQTRSVSVRQGQAIELHVELKKKPQVRIPWWVWVSVGTVVVTAVAGGVWLGSSQEVSLCSTPDLSQCP